MASPVVWTLHPRGRYACYTEATPRQTPTIWKQCRLTQRLVRCKMLSIVGGAGLFVMAILSAGGGDAEQHSLSELMSIGGWGAKSRANGCLAEVRSTFPPYHISLFTR